MFKIITIPLIGIGLMFCTPICAKADLLDGIRDCCDYWNDLLTTDEPLCGNWEHVTDSDIDCDGLLDYEDPDMDGDGIPNSDEEFGHEKEYDIIYEYPSIDTPSTEPNLDVIDYVPPTTPSSTPSMDDDSYDSGYDGGESDIEFR